MLNGKITEMQALDQPAFHCGIHVRYTREKIWGFFLRIAKGAKAAQ